MKKKKSKPSVTVRMVQAKDGSWKILKRRNWKKAEMILKQTVHPPEERGLFVRSDSEFQIEDGGQILEVQSADDLKASRKLCSTLFSSLPSYAKTLELKQEAIWQQLSQVKIRDALDQWLESIQNPRTKKCYSVSVQELISREFLDANWTLQQFSLLSPDQIIDTIKTSSLYIKERDGKPLSRQWSMRTREVRIACFLSFTRYLSRKSEGMIRRGVPSKDGIEKTFSEKPRKVKSEALTRSQVGKFFEELDELNPRDAMIARLCLHGAKRINEVLALKVEQIDFEKKQILFHQSKSKFSDDFTLISFEKPAAALLLLDLKKYIGERKGLVFITAYGKGLKQNQIDRNFYKAGQRAGLPFRVSPHNLRATAVTLWKEDGFSDSLIMKATGHSSSEMVHKYDKSDLADNVTRKSCLI
ncbi:MAG: site-specific integrase [Chlamydiales bacterium]|nr:site-specific integrase [Chlamydiales bacterium]MBY0529919.1 site-specific integrase [Rhabdochlamydiaceae bacterium]